MLYPSHHQETLGDLQHEFLNLLKILQTTETKPMTQTVAADQKIIHLFEGNVRDGLKNKKTKIENRRHKE